MMALVTGGASSGKSRLAEALASALGGRLIYLASMKPYGEEGARRIARHRAQRAGKGFATVECYDGLGPVVAGGQLRGATVLLEDLGNVAANALFSDAGARAGADAARQVEAEMDSLAAQCAHLVIVGNEVGSDGCAYAAETQAYQRLIGRMACWAAARCDLVVESCGGCPVVVKRLEAHGGDASVLIKAKEAMGS